MIAYKIIFLKKNEEFHGGLGFINIKTMFAVL